MTEAPKRPEGEPEPKRPNPVAIGVNGTYYRHAETKAYMDWQAAEIARLRAGNAAAEDAFARAVALEFSTSWNSGYSEDGHIDRAIAAVRGSEQPAHEHAYKVKGTDIICECGDILDPTVISSKAQRTTTNPDLINDIEWQEPKP